MRYGSVQNAEIHLFCSENRNFLQKNKPLILAGGMVFSALTATAQDKVTVAPPTGENICLMSEMDLT